MPKSRKRKLNKHSKKVIKERVIKFVGKLSEESEFVLSLKKKKTSPKTLKIQEAKTATFTAQLFHDCTTDGTYSNPERQEMKRERLHEMKPKRKARWESK